MARPASRGSAPTSNAIGTTADSIRKRCSSRRLGRSVGDSCVMGSQALQMRWEGLARIGIDKSASHQLSRNATECSHAVFDDSFADTVDRAKRRSVLGLSAWPVSSNRWVAGQVFIFLTTSYQRVIMGRASCSKLGPGQAINQDSSFASLNPPICTTRVTTSNRK
jgi:hypothetical protein